MICCGKEAVRNTALGKEFLYCRECKKEVDVRPVCITTGIKKPYWGFPSVQSLGAVVESGQVTLAGAVEFVENMGVLRQESLRRIRESLNAQLFGENKKELLK